MVNEDIEELPMDPSQGHEYLAGGGTWTQANPRGHLAGEGISDRPGRGTRIRGLLHPTEPAGSRKAVGSMSTPERTVNALLVRTAWSHGKRLWPTRRPSATIAPPWSPPTPRPALCDTLSPPTPRRPAIAHGLRCACSSGSPSRRPGQGGNGLRSSSISHGSWPRSPATAAGVVELSRRAQ